MLETWTLTNFKSVYEKIEFPLRPLTMLVGPNSSGKSTFIQSILLIAQTVTNQTPSRQIVLNGHISRLGTYSDLASRGRIDQPITIGFRYVLPSPSERHSSPRYYLDDDLKQVECEVSFAPSDTAPSEDLRQLHPQVVQCRVTTTYSNDLFPDTTTVVRSQTNPDDRLIELGIDSVRPMPRDVLSSLHYRVEGTLSEQSQLAPYYYADAPPSGEPVGAMLRHFVPVGISVRYDATRARAERTVRLLTNLDTPNTDVHIPDDDPYASEALIERIRTIISDALPQFDEASSTAGHPRTAANFARQRVAAEAARATTPSEIRRVMLRARYPQVRTAIAEHLEELVELSMIGHAPQLTLGFRPLLPGVWNAIHHWFSESVRYLGPLRDEPKAVYPLEGAVDPTSVGLRGEFTAAVLDLHKSRFVTYVRPEELVKNGIRAKPRQAPLQAAVIEWLNYLGVLSRIETVDRGVFGHELRVGTNSSEATHNLVHVGVGVSQVLPILVMSLLSEAGSLIVLEQPELHLHPRVQSYLGDFLLSLVASGRQCIVETHSEYMINRLRLRAAMDADDQVHKALALYFVEKTSTASTYRLVDINEYGAIPDWPHGFFDQAPLESEQILRAASAKRRAKRGAQ